MPRYATLSTLAAAAVAAGLLAAGPAAAADTATYCPFTGVQALPDGSQQFGVEANGAGCVVVDSTSSGIVLSEVVLAPGWTDEVKQNSDGRVEVRFAQPTTDSRAEVRAEPGRTEVK